MNIKREFLYLYKTFLVGTYAVLGIGGVLAFLTWWTCHEVYTDSLITTYASIFPLMAGIFPVSFAMAMRPTFKVGISFGASRKALFFAAQILFVLYSALCQVSSFAMNALLCTLPQPEHGFMMATPRPVSYYFILFMCVELSVQVVMWLSMFDMSRWVLATVFALTMGGMGAYIGYSTVLKMDAISFFDATQFYAMNTMYWIALVVLLLLNVLFGFLVYRKIQKEVY